MLGEILARLKRLSGTCDKPGCNKQIRSRKQCASHAKAWARRYDKDRCDWAGCEQILATDDWWQERYTGRRFKGQLKKIVGRRMGTGKDRRSYCRVHEVEHLRPSPAIEELNLRRAGAGLVQVGNCWIPQESIPRFGSGNDGAAKFQPENSNGKSDWAYHRVVWDLLMGGHSQQHELDHLTDCTSPACAAPFHLEPVLHSVNMERRKYRNQARKAGEPFTPNRCGPPINLDALSNQRVVDFAKKSGLALPLG